MGLPPNTLPLTQQAAGNQSRRINSLFNAYVEPAHEYDHLLDIKVSKSLDLSD